MEDCPLPLLFLSPIHRATRQVSMYLEAPTAALGVSNPEGHLLTYLKGYGPCAITELHRVFGLKRSTLTSMLDRLEEREMVVRELDPEDRRSFRVGLTRSGRRAGDRLQAVLDDLEARVQARIRKSDLDGFRTVLHAIGEVTQVEVRPGRNP
jgi:DNA-binding MarR family transcriptional regulator